MLTFDINKLKYDNQHSPVYKVRFKPWVVDNQYTTESIDVMKNMNSQVCYSRLFDLYYSSDDNAVNGICTTIIIKPTTGATLTTKDIDRWITLSVTHKMLPEYFTTEYCIRPHESNKDHFYATAAIKCEGVPQALLYLYLNTFRELYEDPGFVKSVVYLHDELGINFYAAYVFSSFFNKVGTGHHILPITKNMIVYKSESDKGIKVLSSIVSEHPSAELDLNIVRALYTFVNDDSVDRGLPILKVMPEYKNRANSWCCINKITNIFNMELKTKYRMCIPIHMLDHKDIDAIISLPPEKASKLLNKIFKKEIKK